ncbi:MAG: imidazole glycerol phosphate synthase subunit HisH [Proteobacteria bacterium]|nr:imidazole glycerol phosphate synthase subunit HisH [Pseudomonadota bacterium]
MNVVIVDYGSGNLRSAAKAFERAAADTATAISVSADPKALKAASHIVLPGVGAFADCKRGLEGVAGMTEALEEAVIGEGKPFLGICVGMQLMAKTGREHGVHQGLGWIEGEIVPIEARDTSLVHQVFRVALDSEKVKIPHMGWNDLEVRDPPHPVFAGIETGRHVYFVHGYRILCERPGDVIAEVDYGGPLVAAVGRDNIVGTQFHPEKSQATGLRLIANFLDWRP